MKWLRVLIQIFIAGLGSSHDFKTMQIKDLKMAICDSKNYSVTVKNVAVRFGTKPKITISGSLNAQLDLMGPVKALVWLKRKLLGVWIPVPCEDKMGSCTYNDLCDYGIPKNTSCPDDFKKNNVPCRCPIPKGNYTIAPTTLDLLSFHTTSILSGTYKGMVEIIQNNALLSCYNIYFVLYDDYDIDFGENEGPSVVLV